MGSVLSLNGDGCCRVTFVAQNAGLGFCGVASDEGFNNDNV